MKTIPIWVRSWPRNILNLKTVKPYPPKQCVPMLLYLPPPLPPTLGESSVRFRTSKCEHLHQGTTNSFILPQRTLPWQQMLVMSKPPDHCKLTRRRSLTWDVLFLKEQSLSVYWYTGCTQYTQVPRLQTPQDRCLDVTLAARALTICRNQTIMKLLLFHSFHTNNQCYFIFNRKDSPNKGKYF